MTDPKTHHTEPWARPAEMLWGCPMGHDLSNGTPEVQAALAPPPLSIADVAVGDVDDLLSAVKARLRLTIIEPLEGALQLPADDLARSVRRSVLECVSALDQLQLTLTHEFGRRQELEHQLVHARSELAESHTELLGTQAGERLARHLTLHDGLTLLPNRSLFRERLDQALEQHELLQRPFTVLYLDLDGFKRVNDDHGHATGDELLRIVAARLTRAMRAEDVVSRLGGDEFACLLRGLPHRERLSNLARKLFLAISEPFKIGTLELNVRPSIGIATCPTDGTATDTLLNNADLAMYRAKRQQSGYAFFGADAEVGPGVDD